jgi:hypothetical protein
MKSDLHSGKIHFLRWVSQKNSKEKPCYHFPETMLYNYTVIQRAVQDLRREPL